MKKKNVLCSLLLVCAISTSSFTNAFGEKFDSQSAPEQIFDILMY